LRAAEHIITQDEQYRTVEKLCFSLEVNGGGWRRPALLKKLRRTFLDPRLIIFEKMNKGGFENVKN